MEFTTIVPPTYPLIPLAPIIGTVYEASTILRPHPHIRKMSDQNVQRHRRHESFSKPACQNIDARMRMTSQLAVQDDGSNDNKGELRYNFKFPNTENALLLPLPPPNDQGAHHRRNYTVASSQTLGTPSFPSSSPPTFVSEATERVHPYWLSPLSSTSKPNVNQYLEQPSRQPSTQFMPTPLLYGPKKHGFYCTLKATAKSFLWPKKAPNETVGACKHKFRNARCKKCNIPEAIAYLCNLRTGALCKEHEASQCDECIKYVLGGSYGKKKKKNEDRSTTPKLSTPPVNEYNQVPILNPLLNPSSDTPSAPEITPICLPPGEATTTSQPDPVLILSNLSAIVHAALNGDCTSQSAILKLNNDLSLLVPSHPWSAPERHLIRKTRQVLGLQVQSAAGRMPAPLVAAVRLQLFREKGKGKGKDREEGMRRDEFADYMRGCVGRGQVSEARAMQILELVGDDDDDGDTEK